jgi:hypothetical protein
MRNKFLRFFLLIFYIITISAQTKGNDSLKYSFNFGFYRDLSDTYHGGSLFSGEFKAAKSWYGAVIQFGCFQSSASLEYEITFENINKTFFIPINELSIMRNGSFSLMVEPVKHKFISVDLIFGLAYAKSQSTQINTVSYSYSFADEKFIYLYRDYSLIKKTHFGYQVGIDIKFHLSKSIGLELKSRIQDLSNGGTFLFLGTGFCIKL